MILLLGGAGSIGRRYQAVLHAMGESFQTVELGEKPKWDQASHAVICTPTPLHFEHAMEASFHGIPFLCEKPLSQDLDQCNQLVEKCKKGFVVNNYAFLGTNQPLSFTPSFLHYDFYNTGKDGLIWDVCQLIYIAKLLNAKLEVRRESFYWDFKWGDIEVPYQWIEFSYLQMMNSFIRGETNRLWSLASGLRMSEICHHLVQKAEGKACESFNWDPSSDVFQSAAAKNLRNDWK